MIKLFCERLLAAKRYEKLVVDDHVFDVCEKVFAPTRFLTNMRTNEI